MVWHTRISRGVLESRVGCQLVSRSRCVYARDSSPPPPPSHPLLYRYHRVYHRRWVIANRTFSDVAFRFRRGGAPRAYIPTATSSGKFARQVSRAIATSFSWQLADHVGWCLLVRGTRANHSIAWQLRATNCRPKTVRPIRRGRPPCIARTRVVFQSYYARNFRRGVRPLKHRRHNIIPCFRPLGQIISEERARQRSLNN